MQGKRTGRASCAGGRLRGCFSFPWPGVEYGTGCESGVGFVVAGACGGSAAKRSVDLGVLSSPGLVGGELSRLEARGRETGRSFIFVGANLPPAFDNHGLPTGEDGILTGEEVIDLDLTHTELVVLSACETNLGVVRKSDGVFGLQRAFHFAGVRSVMGSLWKVDDDATKTLMIEFYRNLWHKKMSKLEALRQAQLTMIFNYDPQERVLRGKKTRRTPPAAGQPRPKAKTLPPSFWAAFTLSGDWR